MKEKVKLIRIIRNNDDYLVDTETSTRVLGVRLLNRRRRFVQHHGEDVWYEVGKKKPVDSRKKHKLDHWLMNHKRFVL